jgi:hypothetical protein
MCNRNDIYEQLAEDFGLDLILQQNDIEPWEVLKVLHLSGLVDLDDYWFTELEIEDED